MEKCSPVEMRKNLEIVGKFKKYGIDFVPIPVLDATHKKELIARLDELLAKMAGWTK